MQCVAQRLIRRLLLAMKRAVAMKRVVACFLRRRPRSQQGWQIYRLVGSEWRWKDSGAGQVPFGFIAGIVTGVCVESFARAHGDVGIVSGIVAADLRCGWLAWDGYELFAGEGPDSVFESLGECDCGAEGPDEITVCGVGEVCEDGALGCGCAEECPDAVHAGSME